MDSSYSQAPKLVFSAGNKLSKIAHSERICGACQKLKIREHNWILFNYQGYCLYCSVLESSIR